MKIIISPAKKMGVDTDSFAWKSLPQLLSKTEQLYQCLRTMTYDELKSLWRCNDQIAGLNFERLQGMNLYQNLTPAILSYDGIQYRYMAPGVFTGSELSYIQEYLQILSGFYGVLKPFDGVTPYRLEMQAKLKIGGAKDLYSFWNRTIADVVAAETDCILNLASKEYSRCVSAHLAGRIRFITCLFCERKNDKLIEKGTMCKMARGEMVRYLAENQIQDPEKVKSFQRLGYRFSPLESDGDHYVFVKEE